MNKRDLEREGFSGTDFLPPKQSVEKYKDRGKDLFVTFMDPKGS